MAKKYKKRKVLSKSQSERIHAKKRLEQRYGITVNRKGLQTIVDQIRGGQAAFVEKQSLRVSIWDVVYDGKTIRVAYDKSRKNIVTALPLVAQTTETSSAKA